MCGCVDAEKEGREAQGKEGVAGKGKRNKTRLVLPHAPLSLFLPFCWGGLRTTQNTRVEICPMSFDWPATPYAALEIVSREIQITINPTTTKKKLVCLSSQPNQRDLHFFLSLFLSFFLSFFLSLLSFFLSSFLFCWLCACGISPWFFFCLGCFHFLLDLNLSIPFPFHPFIPNILPLTSTTNVSSKQSTAPIQAAL